MLSIGVDEVRELVRRASMSPTLGRRQVLVVEDADRVTERGADALLKSIEEPAPRTVWILCAPDRRRRGGHHPLPLPAAHPADPERRRRRRAAADPRRHRAAIWPRTRPGSPRGTSAGPGCWPATSRPATGGATILQIPFQLKDLGDCLQPPRPWSRPARRGGGDGTADLDARERAALEEALGFGTKGARPRQAQAAIKDLEDQQKARAKRLQRDAIDRALTELTGFYRDVLCVQTGQWRRLVNDDLEPRINVHGRRTSPESTLRRIDALLGLPRGAGGQRGAAAGGGVDADLADG